MQSIILQSFGGTDQLKYRNIPVPALARDQISVKVYAIGINPVDIKTRKGKGAAAHLQKDDPMILGWDISGVVSETGSNVTRFSAGDEVFGMIRVPGHGKAYAEFVAAPAAHLALKPTNISHEEAAGAGIAAVTAWQALVTHAGLAKGQRILIHAASGGVGHFAVQIAKSLGAYVIGTSSAANRNMVLSLGADEHIDHTAQPFEEVVQEVDVVLDAIGGDHIDRSLKVLRKGGTIISLPSGISENVNEKAAAQGKNGIFFFARSNTDDILHIARMFSDGKLHTHIARVFDFTDVAAAHDMIERGRTAGKIVMRGPASV